MNKWQLYSTTGFERTLVAYCRKDKSLKARIKEVTNRLLGDPFYKGLRTHKVANKDWGVVYSSMVTGDLRILWTFQEDNTVLLLLALGGHSGGNKVYK